jgi:hypothetical protein
MLINTLPHEASKTNLALWDNPLVAKKDTLERAPHPAKVYRLKNGHIYEGFANTGAFQKNLVCRKSLL